MTTTTPAPKTRQDGYAMFIFIISATVLILGFALIRDGAAFIEARQRAHGTALQAARAGGDHLSADTYYGAGDLREVDGTEANAAACDWVTQSQPETTCTATVSGSEVSVTVRVTYNATLLAAFGTGTLTTESTATIRPAIGASSEIDSPGGGLP